MIHKFIIELTDDCKGYSEDVERLEREYGIEPVDEHDAKVRSEAIEEYKNRLLELCDCGSEQADCTGGNCYKCMDNQVDYSSIVDLADELKGAI